MPEVRRGWRWLPQSLMGRLSLVMVAGVLVTQLVGTLILARQLRAKAEVDVAAAARDVGHSAANTVRFFRSAPPNYRALLIQQFREMGGTRFFVNQGRGFVPVRPIESSALAERALGTLRATLDADLPNLPPSQLAFAWPDGLVVSDDGVKITDLPDAWVRHILLIRPDPAPVLVIQAELEPGNWLYLATLMPNPYFLRSTDPFSFDRLVLGGLPLVAVLLLSILVVLRWITRPLAVLAEAAEAFGKDGHAPALPENGSREFVSTVRAFASMRERIQKYLEDRERLFISISHDLRTPITRLKLRAELLDDEALRGEFEEDLDDLDMMVKGALQMVKDSDIHENPTELRLDRLLERLVRGARLAGHVVEFVPSGLAVRAKPLALKRAIGNLLDNALFYGPPASVGARREGGQVLIEVRDHGPGVPEEALAGVFDPHVRLAHGRERNEGGLGLGLGIARDIVQAHGGRLHLANHAQGGLVATISLPYHEPARPDAPDAAAGA